MANTNLTQAKRAKNDEFYTQWRDIESEMHAYHDFDENVFQDKTILLPCDDPNWSNFTKFFALNFEFFGLKKLISTSYAPKANCDGAFYHPDESLFTDSNYDSDKDLTHGKKFVLERADINGDGNGGGDINGDGRINKDDFVWEYLDGDGDFRSAEVTALRDEADMVITNPPFSLFRDFVAWLVDGHVQFSVIGNMNAITYKEIFPLIKDNKVWLGAGSIKGMQFRIPENAPENKSSQTVDKDGVRWQKMGNTCWFTNIEHGRRHEPLHFLTMEQNMRFTKRIYNNPHSYKKYDNYDAIEVPLSNGIPSDYAGVMGVPISFLDKYCPEQFEILGVTDRQNTSRLRYKKYTIDDSLRFNDLNARSVIKLDDGSYKAQYARILIRHLHPDIPSSTI